jgi:regulator of sirC expression with transglutaminase-like and TPR domain
MVKEKLVEMGTGSLSLLKEAVKSKDREIQNQIAPILLEIERSELEERFTTYLSASNEIDLEQGAFLMAKAHYPEIDLNYYRSLLDQMAGDLKGLLKQVRQPVEIIRRANHYLFVEQGFHGNTSNYHDPQNSYMNRVIDRKTGIPITLSALYLFLARRIDLPIAGTGMPGHFILRYDGQGQKLLIDPFHGGALLTTQECIRFLHNSGLEFLPSHLEKVSDRAILARMMKNLQVIHAQANAQPELDRINRWLTAILPLEETG